MHLEDTLTIMNIGNLIWKWHMKECKSTIYPLTHRVHEILRTESNDTQEARMAKKIRKPFDIKDVENQHHKLKPNPWQKEVEGPKLTHQNDHRKFKKSKDQK